MNIMHSSLLCYINILAISVNCGTIPKDNYESK